MAKKGFPKYQRCEVSSLTQTKFYKLERGNLFFMPGYEYDMLCVVMNERPDVKFDRNCVVIASQDKGFCGLGMWLDDHEDVYVVEDSNVLMRAYYLL